MTWSWICSKNLSLSPTASTANRAKHSDRIHGFASHLQSDVRRATTRSLEVFKTIRAGPLPCIATIATLCSTAMSPHPSFR